MDHPLIGVDGGASGVRAYRVDPTSFQVLASASRDYPAPEPEVWIATCADCIAELATGRVVVGLALPGVKTADRRGLEYLRNGPAIPNYLDLLHEALADRGMAARLAPLGGDGELATLGETTASLQGVSFGYYVGCGTGVAEGLVLDGQVRGLEGLLPRAWEMGFEERISAAALNRLFREKTGRRPSPTLEEEAAAGHGVARDVLARGARDLVELVQLREASLGRPFERVVVGQRLGRVVLEFGPWFPVPGYVGSTFRAAAAVGAAMRALSGSCGRSCI